MERSGLSADQAFAVLRQISQHKNQKLRDVAAQIVETTNSPRLTVREA